MTDDDPPDEAQFKTLFIILCEMSDDDVRWLFSRGNYLFWTATRSRMADLLDMLDPEGT